MLETRPFGEIYFHFCPTSGKGYVGQTTQGCVQRRNEHVRHSRSIKCLDFQYPFSRAIRKYGAEAFESQVLAVARSKEELDGLEQLWIWALQTCKPSGYNLSTGGDGHTGVPHTAVAKAKMTEAKIGNKFCVGRQVSDETRVRLGNGNRGRKLSSQWKERIAAAGLGRKHSAETKNKIAIANMRRIFTPQHRANLSAARRARTLLPKQEEK